MAGFALRAVAAATTHSRTSTIYTAFDSFYCFLEVCWKHFKVARILLGVYVHIMLFWVYAAGLSRSKFSHIFKYGGPE